MTKKNTIQMYGKFEVMVEEIFELPDGYTVDDIVEYWMKWGSPYIKFSDGKEIGLHQETGVKTLFSMNGAEEGDDFKHPVSVRLATIGWDEEEVYPDWSDINVISEVSD